MLSESGVANLLTRPRPPGSRRSSSTKIDKAIKSGGVAVSGEGGTEREEQDENYTPPAEGGLSDAYAGGNKAGHHIVMERDLELDLPMDLFSVVEDKSRMWPHARHVSANEGRGNQGIDTLDGGAAKGSLNRSLSSKVKKRHSMQEQGRREASLSGQEADHAQKEQRHTTIEAEEKAGHPGESDVESEQSIDSEWVGELPREELESLLMQANRVIKERERDLGIAAAIGKALLEKNISLRSKHEGIMTRLSSINSFSQLSAEGGEEEELEESQVCSNGLPRYTPPTTDSMLAESEEEESTPMPTPRANDYFENTPIPDSPQKRDGGESGLPTYSSWPAANENEEGHGLFNRHDYFVPSIPPSPARSQMSEAFNRSQYYTAETQRQLEILSEQNEELLEQLAQLQSEAEDAKKSGGKRLKKLNREIEGLRAELEAATERNTELEREVADEGQDANSDGDGRGSKKTWSRRRGGHHSQSSDEGEMTLQANSTSEPDTRSAAAEEMTASSESGRDNPGVLGSALPCRSESSASIATESRAMSAPERALIAQLMTKIRELEDTNASLALAGTEMDGRIGKAMVEGERIRDAYEAVEQHAALEETQLMRDESVMSEAQYIGSPYSSATASPAEQFRKRRAPGNRYIIEGRRTLRGVMKSEQSLRRSQNEYYYGSSNESSSASSSPVKGRSIRRSLRPRILITPSTEDLRGSSEADSMRLDLWQRTPQSLPSHHRTSTPLGTDLYDSGFDRTADMQDLSSNQSVASTPTKAVRTLGSELETVQGYDGGFRDSPVQDVVRRLGRDGPLRLTDLQRSASGASIHLRSRASLTSLRAASEAESDIADLRWSTTSDQTVTDSVDKIEAAPDRTVLESGVSADETVQQLALTRAVEKETSLAILDAEGDGTWCAGNEYDVLPRGSLKNDTQSTHDSYEFIEKVTSKLPLQWADDDDFGRPITESDARKMGLLDGARLRTYVKEQRGLLAWVQRKTSINRKKPEKGKGRQKTALQVESREDVEERTQLAELLRAKRIVALRSRVANGHISLEQAKKKGVLEDVSDPFIEEEITTRAFAYSTARQRQHRARQLTNAEGGRSSGKIGGIATGAVDDSDTYRRRPARRGSEAQGPLQFQHQPRVVKQRAKQFSTEAITWASAWATFSLVMVFAFLVAFSRGPKRVLNGNAQKR